MADDLRAALQSKLVAYESAGMDDHAKRVKARLTQLDKVPVSKTVTTTVTTTTNPTAPKKAAKKTAVKKRTK